MFDKDFISPRLQGRTGNMIFQVAHALAKSLEYNKQLVIFRESAVADIEHNIFKKLFFGGWRGEVSNIAVTFRQIKM